MYQGATSPYMVGQPYSNTTLSPHEAAAAAAAAAVDAARRVRFADDNRGAHAAGMPAAYYAPLSVPPPLTDRRTVMPLVSSAEQPVVPASAPAAAAAAADAPSATTDSTSKKPNRAMHESQLRAQVRVLEAEVKLLRDGLQRTATVGERNSSGGIENNNNNNRANTAKPKLAFGRRASPTRAPLARPSRSVSGSKRTEARDGVVGHPGVPSTAMTAHKELPLQGSAHGAMLLPRDNSPHSEAVSAGAGAVSGAGAGGYWNSAKGLYRDATAVAAAPAYVHTSPIKPPAAAAAVINSPLGARPIQVAMSDVQIPTLPMSSAVPQPMVQPPYMPPGPIGQSTMPPPSTVSSYMYPPMSSAGTAPAMQPAAVNIPVAAAPPPPPPVVPSLPAPPPPPAAVTGSIPAPAAISSPVQPSDVSALQSSLLVHQRLVQQQHATIQSLSQRVLELEEVLRNSSRGSSSNTTTSASASAAGAGAAGHDSRHAAMLILTNHLLHAQGEVARLTSLNEMHEKLLREKDAELVALRVACTSAAAAPGNAVSHHQPVQTAVVPPATVAVSSTVAASTSPPVVPLTPAAPPPAVAVVPVAVSPVPPPPAVNSVDAAKLAPSSGCTCRQEVEQLTRKLKAWETWFAKSQQQQQQQQQQRQPGAHKKEKTCAATHASPLGNNPPSDGVVYGGQQANGTCEQNDSRCLHDRPAPYTSEVVIGGGPLSRVDDNHANSAANTKGEAVKPMRSYCTVYDEVVDPLSYMHPCQHPSRPTNNNNNNRPAAADAKENKKEKKSSGGSVVDCRDEEDLTEFLARERVLRELATKERVAAEERLRAVLRHAMDMDGSDNETVATPKKRIADKEKS